MVGRRVTAWQDAGRGVGTVEEWEPLGSGMCDALVRFEDGWCCWYGSHCLTPADGLGPLPTRSEAMKHADEVLLAQLQSIRARHVAGFREPWPGMEFGKVHFGRSVDAAIRDVQGRLKPR